MTDTNTITSSSTLPYKCPPLIDLSPEKEKKILPPSECTSLFSQFSFSHKSIDPSHLYFYYYDCESIHDYGWGCAWRALQTTLRFLLAQSNKYTNSTDMTYKTLFMKYGERLVSKDDSTDEKFLYNTLPIEGAEYTITAAEDIYTQDGQTDGNGKRNTWYQEGDIAAIVKTGENGQIGELHANRKNGDRYLATGITDSNAFKGTFGSMNLYESDPAF